MTKRTVYLSVELTIDVNDTDCTDDIEGVVSDILSNMDYSFAYDNGNRKIDDYDIIDYVINEDEEDEEDDEDDEEDEDNELTVDSCYLIRYKV